MGKFSKYLKNEIDVEVFAGCHVFMYIFMYAFWRWCDDKASVSFQFIVEATIVGYTISWIQKILFLKKGVYKKLEYKIRSCIWIIAPIVITILIGAVLDWFSDTSSWVEIAFNVTVVAYYPVFFFLLEYFYKEDTNELNSLLNHYKENNKDMNKVE